MDRSPTKGSPSTADGGASQGHGGRVEAVPRQKPQGEVNDPPELPVGRRRATGFCRWALETGGPTTGLSGDPIARDTQEILEAGLITIAAGQDRRVVRTSRRSTAPPAADCGGARGKNG